MVSCTKVEENREERKEGEDWKNGRRALEDYYRPGLQASPADVYAGAELRIASTARKPLHAGV